MKIATPTAAPGSFRRPRRRCGLTLLEVLLSLVILLIALAAVGSLVEFGVQRSERGQLQTAGTRLAQSKLAEVEAGIVSATSSQNGTFEEEPIWSWSVTSTATDALNVYAVTVRVSREYRGSEFAVELTQLIFDPTMMGVGGDATPPETNSAGSSSAAASSSTTSGGTAP